MKKKESDSKLKEIEDAMKLFPKKAKRQERAKKRFLPSGSYT